jgi:DnaK suppressor protein
MAGKKTDKTSVGYPAKQLEAFGGMLRDRQDQIAKGFDNQRAEMENLKGEAESDASDDASNQVELNIQMTLSDTQKRELDQIDVALRKIGDGLFGQCEGCGQLIAEARLKALPFATLCVECKGRQEKGSVMVRPEARSAPVDSDFLGDGDDDL